jgi:uncharacterized protein
MITASPAASSFTPGSFTYASQEMADAGFFNKGLGRSLAPPEKATQSMVHGLWSVVRSPWSFYWPFPHSLCYRPPVVTTLLQRLETERRERREELRQAVRAGLRDALRELLPEAPVRLFGSITQPYRFSEHSDVDLALDAEVPGVSIYQLISLLSERLGRRVDVLLLTECRFRDKIIAQGELWTPPH